MKTIGISGKIGSGKTTISKMLMHLGHPVFNTDEEAKKVYEKIEIRNQINEITNAVHFESPNWKAELAAILFTDQKTKNQIETIIHAEVKMQFQEWKSHLNSTICFKESAIISTFRIENTDALWIVEAPKPLRYQRVLKRSLMSIDDFNNRNKIQEELSNFFTGPTTIITNDDFTPLIPQLELALSQI
jgi:dephospho-CoA kinase